MPAPPACLPLSLAPIHQWRSLLPLPVALPQFFLELPKIMNDPSVRISPFIFVTNALAAFGEHAERAGGALACVLKHLVGGAADWHIMHA